MSHKVKLYPVSDSYSFGRDYDEKPFVYENGEIIPLLDSKNVSYINIENFVGGGESVSFELVAYNGNGIVFTSYLKFIEVKGDFKMNFLIHSEEELSDEIKYLIEKNVKHYHSIMFKTSPLTVDENSFFEDINEYKGNSFLYSRISKSDVENLIKQLQDKQ